jgi:hypothetical protein
VTNVRILDAGHQPVISQALPLTELLLDMASA